jgi:hypothetical protein
MTRRHTETNTIQTWPSGASFTYRGDPHGPENQRSLRIPGRNGDSPWRKGSPEEWRTIQIAIRADWIAASEIRHADSALIDDLLKVANDGSLSRTDATRSIGRAFEYDRIENLYADPSEWDAPTCLRYLYDQTGELNYAYRATDWAAEVERFAKHEDRDPAEWEAEATDELRAACREHAQNNPAEVFEWWRVSEWLCQELRAIGQVVIDNDYGTWWGRCTTGQGFIMDGVLQQVAARHEREAQ